MRWVGMPVRFILALAFTPILFLCACIAIDAIDYLPFLWYEWVWKFE